MSVFLYIDGIQGSASDPSYKHWLDIDRYQWHVKRQITSASSTQGDRESSNAIMGDLIITRKMDEATPPLIIEACCGQGHEIKLVTTKTGSGSGTQPFMEYTLGHALISGYNVVAVSQSASRPRETFKISFTNLQAKYTPYDDDGNALAPIAVGFDTATNSKL